MTDTILRRIRLFPCAGRTRRPSTATPGSRRAQLAGALFSLAALTSLLAPATAGAQDAAKLAEEGKKLMGEGKYAEACPKLEEAHKQSPAAGTLYDLASCHEKQGKIATAWLQFIDAEAEARKAGNKRLQADAKARSAMLDLRVPRVTVNVAKDARVEGLEVRLDGAPLDASGFGRPTPVDPGEHKLTAAAPGRKPFEKTFTIKVGGRSTVAVPALAADGSAPAAAAAPAAGGAPAGGAPAEKPADNKAEASVSLTSDSAGAPGAPEPSASGHRAGRFVVDVGIGPSLLIGFIDRGDLSTITSYDYTFRNLAADGNVYDEIAVCNNDICEGVYDPALGVVLGGQAFFGYALKEDLHLGLRVMGGYRLGGGYTLLGGPSGALKMDKLWVGGTLLFGSLAQSAPVTAIYGDIPEAALPYNGDYTQVEVPTAGRTPLPESEIVSTLGFGLAAEISYTLLDRPGAGWSSGALMVSAWPTFVKGFEGFAFNVPVTIGYRFY